MEQLSLILPILIFSLFLIILIDELSINGYKKQINTLKDSMQDLENKLSASERRGMILRDEIKDLDWKINNPPKYTRSHKIGELMVLGCELKNPSFWESLSIAMVSLSSIFLNDKTALEESKKKYENNIQQWEYKLIHTITGQYVKKTELELDQLSKPN